MATLKEQVDELTSLLPQVAARDLDFAIKLINIHNNTGDLSAKAAPWVQILINRVKGIAPAKPQSITVGDLSGLLNLFKTSTLKYPEITLILDGTVEHGKLVPGTGKPVVLKVAGEKSKYKGSIQMTDGKPFGQNEWYGTVTPEGRFDPSRRVTPDMLAKLVPLLEHLSSDAAAAVYAYGKLTGRCMFCNADLNEESSAAGMGEKCSKNWGMLPHYRATTKAHRAAARAKAKTLELVVA
jgi:hypothetical protein